MHCRTVATVSAAEMLKVTTISADARPASGQLGCELVAGHHGSHMALAAAADDGDQWWWLRWDGLSGGAPELVQIDPCDAVLPQEQYADDCMLPHGHPGPHSFDLPPDHRSPVNANRSGYGSRRPRGRVAGGRSADRSEESPHLSFRIDGQ
jgi:hypothetical protein